MPMPGCASAGAAIPRAIASARFLRRAFTTQKDAGVGGFVNSGPTRTAYNPSRASRGRAMAMQTDSYDAIIIGTGQAGPSLARALGGAGLKTAIIERKYVGG